jgi:hypothetical protein
MEKGMTFAMNMHMKKTITVKRKILLSGIFSSAISLLLMPACLAGGDANVGAASSSSSSSLPSSALVPPAGQNLSGGIHHATLCKANLDELDKTYKYIKQAAWEIFAEVQTPDMMYVGGPEVVGTLVLPAVNSSGYIGTGEFRAPRKKWLDYFGMQLNYLVPAVTGEVVQLQPGDAASQETRDSYARLVYLTNKLPVLASDLVAVIHGPIYDNSTIAVRAQEVLDQLKSIEGERKSLVKLSDKDESLAGRKKGSLLQTPRKAPDKTIEKTSEKELQQPAAKAN